MKMNIMDWEVKIIEWNKLVLQETKETRITVELSQDIIDAVNTFRPDQVKAFKSVMLDQENETI